MGWGTGNIGGGTSLNFKIVGNTSEPSSPKENTIWVNTDKKITSYIFSVTEPAAPVEGQVWISTGISSSIEFNALKKNAIQVYPVSAKQYVGGSWIEVQAKIYQSGEWVELFVCLYNSGDQCADITGGWKVVNGGGAKATLDTNCITFVTAGDSERDASAYTKNKINVTNYSKLLVSGKVIAAADSSSDDAINFGLTTTNTKYEIKSWIAKKTIGDEGTFESEVDLSSISGTYYVALYAHASRVEVYTVKLK